MTFPSMSRCVAAAAVAGALALFGCGDDDEQEASAPEDAAAVPADLRGSWKRTMTARDWRPIGGYPTGTWRFDVEADGGVDVYYPRTTTVDFGTQFVVAGGELTIESIPVCPGVEGRYRWRASAGELTLTVVDDGDCEARAALFGGDWRRRR
jgi:hypothetical protein